jgi:BirA family biotin operon repressor/biotin-[acetyl-CoA-carboxylase] ligase
LINKHNQTCRKSLDDFRHVALSDCVSTNIECFTRARAGDAGNLWVTAERQTGGRGRRGRTWVSESGNLYASLLLLDPAPLEKSGSLPLAIALGVYRAVNKVLPPGGQDLAIKWPNDLLINRLKASGILIEAEMLPSGQRAVVIGIGININNMPDNPAYPVTRISDYAAGVSADILFTHLFAEMTEVLNLWNAGEGVSDVMQQWRSVACGIGEEIRVNLPNRSLTGRFCGIDDQGYLILDEGDGVKTAIAAGDVFFG